MAISDLFSRLGGMVSANTNPYAALFNQGVTYNQPQSQQFSMGGGTPDPKDEETDEERALDEAAKNLRALKSAKVKERQAVSGLMGARPQPKPQQQMKLGTNDILPMLIALGGGIAGRGNLGTGIQELFGYMQGKQGFVDRQNQQQNQAYQQELMNWQDQLKAAGLNLDWLGEDIADEEKAVQNEQQRIDLNRKEARADRTANENTARDLRLRFMSSNDPGEKKWIAGQLNSLSRKLGDPALAVANEDLKSSIASLADPIVKQFNQEVQKFWDSASTISEEDRKEYEKARQAIIGRYGVDPAMLRPVPTSESLKKVRFDEQKKHRDETRKLAQEKFAFTKEKSKKDLEVRWFNAETSRGQLMESINKGDTARANMFLKAYDMATGENGLAKEYAKRIRTIDAQLNGLKAKKDDKAAPRIAQLEAERATYQQYLDEENQKRGEVGLPMLSYEQLVQAAQEYAKSGRTSVPQGSAPKGGGAPRREIDTSGNFQQVKPFDPGQASVQPEAPSGQVPGVGMFNLAQSAKDFAGKNTKAKPKGTTAGGNKYRVVK
jgi:hypothetical protein